MKTFDCVKTVSAGRIVFVGEVVLGLEGGRDVIVGDEFIAKHRPVVGGYYVRDEDVASYVPASAFRRGYVESGVLTFAGALAYGKAVTPEGDWVDGMPWHFTMGALVFSHENDDCYVVGDGRSTVLLRRGGEGVRIGLALLTSIT